MPTNTRVLNAMPAGHPGEKILVLRRRLGWSQDTLAKHANVHLNTVSAIEQGKPYTSSTLKTIADALNTTVSSLTKPIVVD